MPTLFYDSLRLNVVNSAVDPMKKADLFFENVDPVEYVIKHCNMYCIRYFIKCPNSTFFRRFLLSLKIVDDFVYRLFGHTVAITFSDNFFKEFLRI